MTFHLPIHRKTPFLDRDSLALTIHGWGRRAPIRAVLLVGAIFVLGGTSQMQGAPTPTAAPAAAPTATPEAAAETRTYSGTQQADYIKTANNEFLEARGPKKRGVCGSQQRIPDGGRRERKRVDLQGRRSPQDATCCKRRSKPTMTISRS